jgi:hypothetical protein
VVALGAIVTDNATPEPALYGLLSPAVRVVEDSTTHWQGKFDYETLDCVSEVRLTSICNMGQSVTAINPTGGPAFRTYLPFNVQTEYKCSTFSRTPEEMEQITLDAAEACVQKAVEREFWGGALAKVAAADWDVEADGAYPNRYLASSAAVDVTPTPGTGVKAKYALALLERAIADCGCGIRGTIHVTRDVASTLGLKPKSDALMTGLGNHVVAGAGYSGTGPNGNPAPAGKAWAYATGPVTVRLGTRESVPDEAAQAVDRKNNTIIYKVDQVAAVTWNSCCHYAVLVDLSLDYS